MNFPKFFGTIVIKYVKKSRVVGIFCPLIEEFGFVFRSDICADSLFLCGGASGEIFYSPRIFSFELYLKVGGIVSEIKKPGVDITPGFW